MGGHSDGAQAAEVGMKVVQDMFTNSSLPIFDPQGFLYMALSKAHDEVVKIGADLAVDFRPQRNLVGTHRRQQDLSVA
jgi:hypothetical protein